MFEFTEGYITGYFGYEGSWGGKVHIVKKGKPICNFKLKKGIIFQWCYCGVRIEYVECSNCIRIIKARNKKK